MGKIEQVLVPDIGDFKDVPVIDVLVKPGDSVKPEDPLIVLESDKATIEVPSPFAGTVGEISIKVGDKVSQGTPILRVEAAVEDNPGTGQVLHLPLHLLPAHNLLPTPAPAAPGRVPGVEEAKPESSVRPAPSLPASAPPPPGIPTSFSPIDEHAFASAHASPSVSGNLHENLVRISRWSRARDRKTASSRKTSKPL